MGVGGSGGGRKGNGKEPGIGREGIWGLSIKKKESMSFRDDQPHLEKGGNLRIGIWG